MKKKKPFPYPSEMAAPEVERPFKTRTEWGRVLKDTVRIFRRPLNKSGYDADRMLDFTAAMLKRRSDAILNHMDEIHRRFQALTPSFADANVLGREWIHLNLPPAIYSTIEAQSYILFSACIWILDRLDTYDELQALSQLLTHDERDLDDLDSPAMWDCQHDEFLIASVQHLIYERNSDLTAPEFDFSGNRKVLTSSLAASGIYEPCESRKIYDAMIAMLPETDIERAVSRFRTLFWAWTDRYFRCMSRLQEQTKAQEAVAEQLRLKYNATHKELLAAIEASDAERKKNHARNTMPAKGSPLMRPSTLPEFPVLPSEPLVPFPTFNALEQKCVDLSNRLNSIVDEIEAQVGLIYEAQMKQHRLQITMTRYGRPSKNAIEVDFGPEVAAEINDLEIGDPYELCFAFLYLIESGDDLPWLYGPGVGLLQEIAESLPWGVYEYDEEHDPLWIADEDCEPEPVKPSNIPDWYERKYLYRKGRDDEFPRSLAQIVYEQTGCLMPRDMHLYDGALKELSAYGIRGKDATGLLYCMLALANSRHRDSAFNLDSDMQRLLDLEDELPGEAKTRLTYDELSEKADRQKEEIQALRKALHEAERGAKTARKELERVQSEAQTEHRELADLREYVFLYDTAEEEPEEEIEESFPYEVQRETLVFGGHATWAKAIKPMLTGNIRFLDKDKGFDSAIIRRADVVWIQANALSHSRYYAIIDAVRQFKKPVRYFSYASAVKSARQLREADRVMG